MPQHFRRGHLPLSSGKRGADSMFGDVAQGVDALKIFVEELMKYSIIEVYDE